MPITTDSHFGEYLQWAYDVVDHKGILDFYTYYKQWTLRNNPEITYTIPVDTPPQEGGPLEGENIVIEYHKIDKSLISDLTLIQRLMVRQKQNKKIIAISDRTLIEL